MSEFVINSNAAIVLFSGGQDSDDLSRLGFGAVRAC